MTTRIPAKSILKQPSVSKQPTIEDEAKAQAEKDKRNLSIALHHAYKIQDQKDAEAKILDAMLQLIELPAADDFTAQEAAMFLGYISMYQPSDYDSLVEERRIDGKCGYTLCRRSPRRETLTMKLTPGLANWCSDACARKGVYVKAQLSSIPIWERSSNFKPDIQLHQDDQGKLDELLKTPEATAIRRANRAVRVDAWRKEVESQNQQKDLAAERGESVQSFRPGQILAEGIIERSVRSGRARPPEPETDIDAAFDTIEGYQPKRKTKDGEDSDDD